MMVFEGFRLYFTFRLCRHYRNSANTHVGHRLRPRAQVVVVPPCRPSRCPEVQVGLGQGAGRGQFFGTYSTTQTPEYSWPRSSPRRELGGESSLASSEKIFSRRLANAIYPSVPLSTLMPVFVSTLSTLDIVVRV